MNRAEPFDVDRAMPPGAYRAAIRARTLKVALLMMACASVLGAGLAIAATSIGTAMLANAVAATLLCLVAVAAGARWFSTAIADAVSSPAQALLEDAVRDSDSAASLGRLALTSGSLGELKTELETLSSGLAARAALSSQTIAELVRIKEHAQSTNLAKSQFLASIGHELRTPLNAVVGYATLMREDAVADGHGAHEADLGRILDASRRLIELISDVLDLSNMETGKIAFQPGIINVEALVTSATARLDGPDNGNKLRIDIDPAVGIMVGDEAKTRRCLANILGNALKFTHDGNIDLRVSLVDVAGVENICFAISDTGPGMTQDEIAVAFDPFVSISTARQVAGAGLGLAVTRRLVGVMGGEITAQSVPGQGSTFRIVLPRLVGNAAPVKPAPDYSESAPFDAASFEKVALVIDDDPTAIAIMRRRLAPFGYGVIGAADGDDGLALARSEKPDLIVLDIHMPGKNGYEVLEAIRADETIRTTPVVVATVDEDRPRGLKSGATDYLTKPVAREQLADVLNLYRDQVDGEILIVDDDRDAGDLIARTAAEVGLQSRRAFDGAQALDMIRVKQPCAIVLDLTMPGMSGFALLDRLRADSELRDIPVIIVSGRSLTEGEHDVIVSSGYTYYTKGEFSPREVAQTLKSKLAA